MDLDAIAEVAVAGLPAAAFPRAIIIDNDATSSASGDSFKGTAALRAGRALSDVQAVAMAQDDFISFLFDDNSAFGPGRGARPLSAGPLTAVSNNSGGGGGSSGGSGGVETGADGPTLSRESPLSRTPLRAGTDPRRSAPTPRRPSERAERQNREDLRFSAPVRRALARVKVLSYLS
jgi:hypothetical protein